MELTGSGLVRPCRVGQFLLESHRLLTSAAGGMGDSALDVGGREVEGNSTMSHLRPTESHRSASLYDLLVGRGPLRAQKLESKPPYPAVARHLLYLCGGPGEGPRARKANAHPSATHVHVHVCMHVHRVCIGHAPFQQQMDICLSFGFYHVVVSW